ncbi:MAG TPA: trehalose-phosphatase [Jiangellales bacterium]|nr:trehalose-phosphatase [Jiangellales bacterium]
MGELPTPETARARSALVSAIAEPARTLVAMDFDGTLAPIVSRPENAVAHADAADAMARLAAAGFRIAVITGRPVADVLRLGDRFAEVPGLVIYGHYGLERWVDGQLAAPEMHPGVVPAKAAVEALASAYEGVDVEDKVHSVALHTRNAPDPAAAFADLRPRAGQIGAENDLEVVPGRFVLELRPPGMDKGRALRRLIAESDVRAVVFAGDDLGDLPAVRALRELDVAGVVVCSDSAETPDELRQAADIVVDGPAGVIELLRSMA